MDRRVHYGNLPLDARLLDVREHVAGFEVRVFADFRHVVDRSERNLAAEDACQLLFGITLAPGADGIIDSALMLKTRMAIGETWILRELCLSHQLRQLGPRGIEVTCDRDPPVFRGKHAERR